jgi:hypothetical protein
MKTHINNEQPSFYLHFDRNEALIIDIKIGWQV